MDSVLLYFFLFQHEYKIPRLKHDALPSKFLGCPQYVSQTRKRRKSPKKREYYLLPGASKIKKTLVFKVARRQVDSEEAEVRIPYKNIEVSTVSATTSCENNVSMDSSNNFSIASETGKDKSNIQTDFMIKSTTDKRNDFDETDFEEVGDEVTSLFESMFENDTLMTCPLPWTQQNIWLGDGNKIQFVHWDSKFVNGKCRPVCHKQLVLSNDLSIHLFVNGVSFEIEKIGLGKSVSSPTKLNTILSKLNSFKVCRGCANPSEDINLPTSFASVDESGYLRHKDCSLLIAGDSKLTRCDTCYKGRNTLKKREKRFKDRTSAQRLKKLSPLSKKRY